MTFDDALSTLLALVGRRVRRAVAAAFPGLERTGLTRWDLGDVPREVRTEVDGLEVVGHPALIDEGGILAHYEDVGRHNAVDKCIGRALLLGLDLGQVVLCATGRVSSEMAFKIAASMAVKDAVEKADPTILEPMMRVEVTLPESFMGDVIGDLNSRRGLVEGTEMRGTTTVVRAAVPLAEMFGYATDLRSMTQGRASYSMELSHYAEVPGNLAQELVAKSRVS